MQYSKKTNKLFFGKYVNKVAVRLSVASYFRGKDLENAKAKLDSLEDQFRLDNGSSILIGGRWSRNHARPADLLAARELINILESLSNYTLRVEGTTLGLYSNDDDFVIKITSIPGLYIEETSEAADDKTKKFLLAMPKAIIRKEYTHKYKVTVNALWDDADSFVTWADKLPKIKTTGNSYQFGGYFYVADEKTLSLCRIFLGDRLRKVEELVTSEEI